MCECTFHSISCIEQIVILMCMQCPCAFSLQLSWLAARDGKPLPWPQHQPKFPWSAVLQRRPPAIPPPLHMQKPGAPATPIGGGTSDGATTHGATTHGATTHGNSTCATTHGNQPTSYAHQRSAQCPFPDIDKCDAAAADVVLAAGCFAQHDGHGSRPHSYSSTPLTTPFASRSSTTC